MKAASALFTFVCSMAGDGDQRALSVMLLPMVVGVKLSGTNVKSITLIFDVFNLKLVAWTCI